MSVDRSAPVLGQNPSEAIPLHAPTITDNAWEYLKACLDSGWVSSAGPIVTRFEAAISNYLGARYAVATVNGTSALHIALQVAGVQPEDEVLVPTLTFIAPVNAISYCGAYPVLMDVDPATWTLDVDKTIDFIQKECIASEGVLRNRKTGRRIGAVLPVHVLGHPVDIDPILEVCRRYGVPVVEDAAEGLGAEYRGRKAGHLGDVACLSFNGNKVITAGGGGAIVTDNPTWAERARHLTTQAKCSPDEYFHDEVGYNYRMSSLNAALGLAQMEELDRFLEIKKGIAARYQEALVHLSGITVMAEAEWAQHNFWLYTVLVDEAEARAGRKEVLRGLRERRIEARSLWGPVHRQPIYRTAQAYHVEHADRIYAMGVSLPSSVSLTESQQFRVIDAMVDILESSSHLC